MPVDVRKIIFSNRELRLILPRFCRDKGIQLPDSPMQDFEIMRPDGKNRIVSENTPEGLKVVLRFVSANPMEPFRVILSQNDILEALIGACREAKIPLPRRANKYLQVQKDSIALAVGLSDNVDFSRTEV
ncbi:MAG: hypothetical protein OEX17_02075 [Rhodospirillaceae bacterium]|nr:hypothetical protein [Rhodospirillaceae bacterium]